MSVDNTLGERMARIEEKLDRVLDAIKHGDELLQERLDTHIRNDYQQMVRKVDGQGERFGERLDDLDAAIKDISEWRQALRNRSLGLVLGGSLAGSAGFVGLAKFIEAVFAR